jgi:hypothetical protein
VFDAVCDSVDNVIEDEDVEEFYIGRTVDPVGTKSRHDADELYLVYETTSLDSAMDMEHALIKVFIDHPKCNNDEGSCAGGMPETFDFCYAYVAVWRGA